MSSTDYHYFIITRKPEHPGHINAGSICYSYHYKYRTANSSPKLSVCFLGSQLSLDYNIEVKSMEELSPEEAGLLQALADDAERLQWFRERKALRTALGLTEGAVVIVDEGGEKLRGIIRYIGNLTHSHPLSGTFFGIELQGEDRGKGSTDGKYQHQTFFSCSEYSGIFAPFSRVRPLVPSSLSPSIPAPSSQPEELEPGERVTYFIDDKCLHGMVLNVRVENGQDIVVISTVSNISLVLEEDTGVSDGTFKKERLFACPPKRALFVKLISCRPDSRFQSTSAKHSEMIETEHSTGKPETVPPISTEQVNQMLIGRMRGIQGHCNSCYMDAALFSLFSCSSVLDSMLFKSTEPQDAPIQSTLLHNIVNPLRSKGFVEGRHIMKLRQQLQKHGYSHSFTTDEKDPEEFLTVIMQHILALDPLLKLSKGGKVLESYCYQVFLDQNHSLVLPTVQQLLEHSFHSEGLKLAEVPSCLILQMPRFGKKFKMFDKIIPSLELDITDLLSEGPQQCMLCGNLAQEECTDCFKDPLFSQTGFKIFCNTCSSQVHSHPLRRSHQRAPLDIPKGYLGHGTPHTLTRDKLELFAVLCIETSHYVSFIKHGPNSQDWIFFDSMADRQGEKDGFNIPEVHHCPEVGMYMEMSPAELANQVPRDMKGVAKRLFCDAYMYLYQSTNMCLYR
uniref:Ubiquitin carboxyl-terminal hydrolase CYLD n=1 Tax=Dicentrarchus labrax TaxID=13489 RepID=A0A8C4EUH0_DICLA